MGRRPYSDDLRARVVTAVTEGCSRRAAGKRFAVSVSSSIRWVELHEETGSISPRRRGGKSRSPLETHRQWLLDLVAAEPDLTLDEVRARLRSEKKQKTATSSVWRFYERHAITFKKNSARRRAGSP